MPLLTRCPHCGYGKSVPDDSLGVTARCPKCREKFVVVPDYTPDADRRQAHSASPEAPTAEAEATAPVAVLPRVPAPLPLLEPAFSDAPTPAPYSTDPQPVGPGVWATAGLSAVAAVGAGVSAAVTSLSFLVIPLAVVGAVAGAWVLVTLFLRQRPWLERVVPAVAAAGSALILLTAVFAPDVLSPQYDAGRQKSTYDPAAVEVVPVGGELVDPRTLGSATDGVDASRAALQQGPVRVQVTGVTVGPVELATATPSATAEKYLVIGVQIRHVGHGGPVSFVVWGSAVPKPITDVRLTRGNTPVAVADLGTKAVRGKMYFEHALTPSTALTTKLVFDVPPGPAEPLTLELPAEAWGQTGVFRFRIPAAMVPAAPKK